MIDQRFKNRHSDVHIIAKESIVFATEDVGALQVCSVVNHTASGTSN